MRMVKVVKLFRAKTLKQRALNNDPRRANTTYLDWYVDSDANEAKPASKTALSLSTGDLYEDEDVSDLDDEAWQFFGRHFTFPGK